MAKSEELKQLTEAFELYLVGPIDDPVFLIDIAVRLNKVAAIILQKAAVLTFLMNNTQKGEEQCVNSPSSEPSTTESTSSSQS